MGRSDQNWTRRKEKRIRLSSVRGGAPELRSRGTFPGKGTGQTPPPRRPVEAWTKDHSKGEPKSSLSN